MKLNDFLKTLVFALAFVAGTTFAQTKGEICNDSIDNDGDKLVDCADQDCATSEFCKKATGCSPGFYKNHLTLWVGTCCNDTTTDPSCAELLEALTCKGSDASCGRSGAAAYLDSCTACSE